MIAKIFDKIESIAEVNRLALELRRIGMKTMLTEIAEKYHISKADVDQFIEGKKYFLVDGGDTRKSYDTARSKLLDEMLLLKDDMFGEIIGRYLIQNCNDDNLKNQLLLPYKTLQRCINFLMEKAYSMLSDEIKEKKKNAVWAACDEDVFAWVREYYMEDDQTKVENEIKELNNKFVEEQKPVVKRLVGTGSAKGKKKVVSTGKSQHSKTDIPTNASNQIPDAAKTDNKQFSLFDVGLQIAEKEAEVI